MTSSRILLCALAITYGWGFILLLDKAIAKVEIVCQEGCYARP